jgi:DNA-binding LacI/PurR family transcriptional regulator
MRLRRDGRRIPEDLSLVSLDGRDLTRAVGITAVEGAMREEGERAVAELLGNIRGNGESSVHELSWQLAIRESTGRA